MEEEPPTTKKTWWQKHKEDILILTSIGSFMIALLQLLIQFWILVAKN